MSLYIKLNSPKFHSHFTIFWCALDVAQLHVSLLLCQRHFVVYLRRQFNLWSDIITIGPKNVQVLLSNTYKNIQRESLKLHHICSLLLFFSYILANYIHNLYNWNKSYPKCCTTLLIDEISKCFFSFLSSSDKTVSISKSCKAALLVSGLKQ